MSHLHLPEVPKLPAIEKLGKCCIIATTDEEYDTLVEYCKFYNDIEQSSLDYTTFAHSLARSMEYLIDTKDFKNCDMTTGLFVPFFFFYLREDIPVLYDWEDKTNLSRNFKLDTYRVYKLNDTLDKLILIGK